MSLVPGVTHESIDLDDITLHVAFAGDPAGPPVVLLHGFPEFWYSWKHQIPALARAGFRVIAPDMRGYNLSSKPEGIASYGADLLARDISLLIQASGYKRAHVVGHDWGAAVAWYVAMTTPERIDRLAILNGPHPAQFLKRLLLDPSQMRRSWYIFLFQLPGLAERRIRRHDFAELRRMLRRDPVRPGAFSCEDIERYVEALGRPGALTSAIHYYRAALRGGPFKVFRRSRPVEAETLIIWGRQDRYLGSALAEPSAALVPRRRTVFLPEAGHWVHFDAPDEVNHHLIAHFSGA